MKVLKKLTKHFEGQDSPYGDLVEDLHRDKEAVKDFTPQQLYNYLNNQHPFVIEFLVEMYEELNISVKRNDDFE